MVKAGALLLVGCLYALFCRKTGWGIPCLFYVFTGLYCPGCGATRMFTALLRLDFAGAFHSNPALLLALPVLAGLLLHTSARYVKSGTSRLSRPQSAVVWAMAVYFIAFGILRNLPG